eukprot:CAMPEP_0201527486 /NCGR_PEP_ID=MMETSP0161_2-20130828/35316_1 /ASSEMBLY_ACC=CAM_ASM_000251 /TAXON_ID=180227 /ORGANISM="Neoparamoeba aestuarina, Strain SoJaBio B1-5/56/2" /LENGTH=143 /DNA_ID=CAMNT_0047928333 /DNA_START=136 /DNA_END=563 /DNA_ORIENTATION=-
MKKRVVYVPVDADLSSEHSAEETNVVRIGRGRAVQVLYQPTTDVNADDEHSRADAHACEEDVTGEPGIRTLQFPQVQGITSLSAPDDFEESSEDDIPAFPVTSMYTKEELADLSDLSHSETEFISEPKNEGIVENRCRQIEAR